MHANINTHMDIYTHHIHRNLHPHTCIPVLTKIHKLRVGEEMLVSKGLKKCYHDILAGEAIAITVP